MLFSNMTSLDVTVDKYSTLSLDASNSYDPEGLFMTYSYIWGCPQTIAACSSQSASLFSLSYQNRYLSGINELD